MDGDGWRLVFMGAGTLCTLALLPLTVRVARLTIKKLGLEIAKLEREAKAIDAAAEKSSQNSDTGGELPTLAQAVADVYRLHASDWRSQTRWLYLTAFTVAMLVWCFVLWPANLLPWLRWSNVVVLCLLLLYAFGSNWATTRQRSKYLAKFAAHLAEKERRRP